MFARLAVPLCSRQTVDMDAETASSTPVKVGPFVVRRRLELGMDAIDLTRLAGVDPKTLRGLETDQRWPRDASRGKIERALQWPPGTLDQLAKGEELTETTRENPHGNPIETAVQLVLAMDEVHGRLQSTILTPEVRKILPPATQGFLDYLDFASQLAETLAVSVAGSGEALARLKREERAKQRAVTWEPPSEDHQAELEERSSSNSD